MFPVELSQWVTDSHPQSSSGVIDLRATYGGLSIAVGIILCRLGSNPVWLSLGLQSVALVLLAMAAGRVLGMVLDGSPNPLMYLHLAGEVLFAVLALALRGSVEADDGH